MDINANELIGLILAIPMWVSLCGTLLMIVSLVVLIALNKQLGKVKVLVEIAACVGGLLASPIALHTLIG